MKGVLLSGGSGTRLRPITHTGPKQLVPVANKPVHKYAIEVHRDVGVTEIGVVLANLGRDAIQEFLGDGSRFGVDITKSSKASRSGWPTQRAVPGTSSAMTTS